MPGSAKQKALEAIEQLPADATAEDAIERLVLLAKIESTTVRPSADFSGDSDLMGAAGHRGR